MRRAHHKQHDFATPRPIGSLLHDPPATPEVTRNGRGSRRPTLDAGASKRHETSDTACCLQVAHIERIRAKRDCPRPRGCRWGRFANAPRGKASCWVVGRFDAVVIDNVAHRGHETDEVRRAATPSTVSFDDTAAHACGCVRKAATYAWRSLRVRTPALYARQWRTCRGHPATGCVPRCRWGSNRQGTAGRARETPSTPGGQRVVVRAGAGGRQSAGRSRWSPRADLRTASARVQRDDRERVGGGRLQAASLASLRRARLLHVGVWRVGQRVCSSATGAAMALRTRSQPACTSDKQVVQQGSARSFPHARGENGARHRKDGRAARPHTPGLVAAKGHLVDLSATTTHPPRARSSEHTGGSAVAAGARLLRAARSYTATFSSPSKDGRSLRWLPLWPLGLPASLRECFSCGRFCRAVRAAGSVGGVDGRVRGGECPGGAAAKAPVPIWCMKAWSTSARRRAAAHRGAVLGTR